MILLRGSLRCPEEPIAGLLSKDYARERAATINSGRNDPLVKPGDPYPFQVSQSVQCFTARLGSEDLDPESRQYQQHEP